MLKYGVAGSIKTNWTWWALWNGSTLKQNICLRIDDYTWSKGEAFDS